MGIKGLFKFLQDAAPKCIKEVHGPEAFTGRTIAIDASMCLYQFLIMIREGHSGAYMNLTNQDGEVTSHIVGFITRTIRLIEAGIKPIYVFDGKPPELKLRELEARKARRKEVAQVLEEAKESGDSEQVLKSTKMSVKVTPTHNAQAKRLLRLMGLPVVEAPSEAEATCAALCKAGKVYAAATEDGDCLTFGTSILIRNLLAAEAQKKQIYEVHLKVALEQLDMSMEQFIDFCILCGCDYCDHVKGFGPQTSVRSILQQGSIEKVLESLDPAKRPEPSNFKHELAKQFFQECESVDPSMELKWEEPDFEGLRKFLVEENSFAEDRVARYCDRLRGAKSKTKQQPLSMFFGVAKPVIRDCDKFDVNKKKKALAAPKASGKAKAKAKSKAMSSSPTEVCAIPGGTSSGVPDVDGGAAPSTPPLGTNKRGAAEVTTPKKRARR
jgi:flap endonuclease-1